MVEEHYVPGILACYLVLIVEESEGHTWVHMSRRRLAID